MNDRKEFLAEFQKDPADTFSTLITGFPKSMNIAGEAPDLAFDFFHAAPDSVLWSLSKEALAWLEARRKETAPSRYPQRQCWIREVQEVFDIVLLLRLKDAAFALRRDMTGWNCWVADLVLSPSRDARWHYWMMLALTQPLLFDSGLPSLEPNWRWIAEKAGTELPSYYALIAKRGLELVGDGCAA